MKTLAIIGSGFMAKNIGEVSRKKGVKTLCFSNDENAVAKSFVDKFFLISIYEKDKIVEICKEQKVSGVIATTEITIAIAAYISDKLGLIGNSYTNKAVVRNAIGRLSCINNPKFIECSGTESLPSNFNYPVIVKPTQLGGKRGITVVYRENDLKQALDYANEAISKRNQKIIIEEFLSGGKEFSVESLSYKGKHFIIQITEKLSSGPPHCVELGHMQPADISEEEVLAVKNAVSAVLSEIGFENGASHTEIKIIDEKIYLIEVNCRPGGDHIAYPLTDLSTGYSYLGGAIDIALDQFDPKILDKSENNFAGVFFVTNQTRFLSEFFSICEKFPWIYKANKVTDYLSDITHNDGCNTNYFIYYSKTEFPNELAKLLKDKANYDF